MKIQTYFHKNYHDEFFLIHFIPSLTFTKSEYHCLENESITNLFILAFSFLLWDVGIQITKPIY